jgi:hypothetical protein
MTHDVTDGKQSASHKYQFCIEAEYLRITAWEGKVRKSVRNEAHTPQLATLIGRHGGMEPSIKMVQYCAVLSTNPTTLDACLHGYTQPFLPKSKIP